MFSKDLVNQGFWPDKKDRPTYNYEFCGNRGLGIQFAITARGFCFTVKTRIQGLGTLFLRFLGRASVLAGLALVLFATTAGAQSSVSLAWNADKDPTVVGYNVCYGTSSGSLTKTVNVGNVTAATVSGLSTGTKYYFAVTAYNAA